MKLKITVLAVPSESANATISSADGSFEKTFDVKFSPRSGSNGKSVIANFPKALKDLGTATNLTLAVEKFVAGSVLEIESKPSTHSGVRRASTKTAHAPDPLFTGISDTGAFEIYAVAVDGTKVVLFSTDNAELLKAYALVSVFNEWQKTAVDSAQRLRAFNNNSESVRAQMKAWGMPDETIKTTIDGMAPKIPEWVNPSTVEIAVANKTPKAKK